MMPEILAIVPARGGSKGIPRKNIKRLCGKPLLAYTAEAALNSKYICRTVLSTEDREIALVGKDLGLDVPFMRPVDLAQDDTPALPVFQHALNQLSQVESYQPDIIVVLQPTSPLRLSQHVDEALESFLEAEADSLVSVVDVPHNMNPYSVMELGKDGYLSNFMEFDELTNLRQLKPRFVARNGAALYIATCNCLMNKNSIFGDRVMPYHMSKLCSVDLDDYEDWLIAELLIRELRENG